MNKIGIINFPSSNTKNLVSALRRNSCDPKLITNKKELNLIDKIILPGVGSAKAALQFLDQKKMKNEIKYFIKNGTPLMGICLGMQILFEYSEEFDIHCLGIYKGDVKKLNNNFTKVPNIGWHKIIIKEKKKNKMPRVFDVKKKYFYFIHSYYCLSNFEFDLSYSIDLGIDVLSAFEHKNVFCSQFHPELSGEAGDTIFKNFIKI